MIVPISFGKDKQPRPVPRPMYCPECNGVFTHKVLYMEDGHHKKLGYAVKCACLCTRCDARAGEEVIEGHVYWIKLCHWKALMLSDYYDGRYIF